MRTARASVGLQVIIAGAGGAAHLPGMCAAWTPLPVLGVPVESHALKGMDSLLSIVQMPAGIPVGTLAIGRAGAVNAALAGGLDPGAERHVRWPSGWTRSGRSRPRRSPRRRVRCWRPDDGVPAPAECHDRPGRRRPAWPHVGPGGGAPGLSLPYPDPGNRQPRRPGLARRHDQRLQRSRIAAGFAGAVDVISFEFENVSAEGLDLLASIKPVRPAPSIAADQPGPDRGKVLSEQRRGGDCALGRGRDAGRAGSARSSAWACRRC